MKKQCILILLFGITIGMLISVITSSSMNYSSKRNVDKVINVNAATTGTCTNISSRLSYLEGKDDKVNYSTPIIDLPEGYIASAYKQNGMVVLTVILPGGVSGWVTVGKLIPELVPSAVISGNYRYASYIDLNKLHFSITPDAELYGFYVSALNYNAYAQFVYPVS